jgi:hypothetical protein
VQFIEVGIGHLAEGQPSGDDKPVVRHPSDSAEAHPALAIMLRSGRPYRHRAT